MRLLKGGEVRILRASLGACEVVVTSHAYEVRARASGAVLWSTTSRREARIVARFLREAATAAVK